VSLLLAFYEGAGMTSTQQALKRLLLVVVLFCFGLGFCHVFEFTVPLLNALLVLAVLAIPWFALKPLFHLPLWTRWVGGIVMTPFLFLMLFLSLVTVSCGPPGTYRYKRWESVVDFSILEMNGYRVRLFNYCYGGALGGCVTELRQERTVFPGLLLVRTVDSFAHSWGNKVDVAGPNTVRVRWTEESISGSERSLERTYQLRRFFYF
jgi:hypothetical protein